MHWFEDDDIDHLATERDQGASLHAPEMVTAGRTRPGRDLLEERRAAVERQELELREADLVERKAERARVARRDLERRHAENCGEARARLIELWRERRPRRLHLTSAADLRFLLAVLVPMTQAELDEIPSHMLSRVESELQRALRQVERINLNLKPGGNGGLFLQVPPQRARVGEEGVNVDRRHFSSRSGTTAKR